MSGTGIAWDYNDDSEDPIHTCKNCGYDFDEDTSDANYIKTYCSIFCEIEAERG